MSINVCNNNSLSAITSIPTSISGSALNLISTQTASSSATISFTSGIDSTYKEYIFKFINIHPATDNVKFQVNFSVDTGSNYNVTKTTTMFNTYHDEGGSSAGIQYNTSNDLAQSTSNKPLTDSMGNANDENCSGYLHLFDPSNTTFVKHFMSRHQQYTSGDYSYDNYSSGYFNTTSAIDAIQFKMSSGNIDSGVIKLYGVN
tara:strand:+ start:54 stop:659 length:606 start_codon:yes stop_codon:yes gene_type:complete